MTRSAALVSLIGVIALGACVETTRSTTPSIKTAAIQRLALLSPQQQRRLPWPQKKVYPPASHLSGLGRDQITALLGTPGFKREDDPALIWQYRSTLCALDLFLYRSGAGDAYTVRHFEARSRGDAAVSEKDCFNGLLIAHEQRG